MPSEPGASLVFVLFIGAGAWVDVRSPSQGVTMDVARGLFAVGAALLTAAMVLGLIATMRDDALRAATASCLCFFSFWGLVIVLRMSGIEAQRPSVAASLPASFLFAMFTVSLGTAVIGWWADRHHAPWRRGPSGQPGES